MCVAALQAKKYDVVHLLTFYDESNKEAPLPHANVKKLRDKYTDTEFVFRAISTDRIVRRLNYHGYFRYLMRYRLLAAATCAFTSLSWHLRALVYCMDNKISHVSDGLTREMMQLPGHMDRFVQLVRSMYREMGITYENPVREWSVPADQQFLDRLIVDQHGFVFQDEEEAHKKNTTTGRYLFDQGVFPHPNIKGSRYDRSMQHDCYPFVLYNILFFWFYSNFYTYEQIESRIGSLVGDKIADFMPHLKQYQSTHDGLINRMIESV